MYDEFCIQQRKRGDAHLAKFLAANPECSLDHDEPQWLKGTHLVAFGSYRGRPAVFKYYDGDPRNEHEKRALELFAPTGLVPEIVTVHGFRESLMLLASAFAYSAGSWRMHQHASVPTAGGWWR